MKIFAVLGITLFTTLFFAQGKNIEISGLMENGASKKIYLSTFVGNNQMLIDSAIINKKNTFSMKLNVGAPAFYTLSFQPEIYILLQLDSVSSESKIVINGDANNLIATHTVKGSIPSASIEQFTKNMSINREQLAATNKLFYASSSILERNKIQITKDSLERNTIIIRDQFINQNYNSVASIIALGYLTMPQDLELLKKVEKGLALAHPNSEYYIAIKTQLTQIEEQIKSQEDAEKKRKEFENKTAIGAIAPELGPNFKSPKGDMIPLLAVRGNYVLIDFWASWCGPCRKENPNVVKLYNKYKDAGFTVYSVSLDKSKEAWENAIIQDGLIWPSHISDLKQWQTEATQIYGFNGIPYTVLIDKEGRIIEKNLRGAQLDEKLKQLFGY